MTAQPPVRTTPALPFGTACDGTPVTLPVTGPRSHLLVTAPTGQGVTTTLTVLALEAAAAGFDVRVADPYPDGLLASRLRGIPGITIASGPGDSTALLQDTAALQLSRFGALSEGGAADWPPLILIADDFDMLTMTAVRQLAGEPGFRLIVAATDVVTCGRAAGITLITGTHHLALAPGILLESIGTRAGLGSLPRHARIQLAGTAAAARPDQRTGSGFVTDGITWTPFRATDLPVNPAE
jgi:hypothetical protein